MTAMLNTRGASDPRVSNRAQTHPKSAFGLQTARRWPVVLLVAAFAILGASTGLATTKTSVGTGTWNVSGTWDPSSVPGSGDDVIITNGSTVTVSVAPTSPTTVTINAGGKLGVAGVNFGVTGATTVSGTLEFTIAGGTKTFTGDVTINSDGTWNEAVAQAISFGGNLQNDGALTASNGIHTCTGATKTFSGAKEIAIPKLTVNGTYQNSGILTVSTTLAGTGTLTQVASANSILNIGAASVTVTTFDASGSGNTVNYTGAAQTVKPTTYNNLTLSGSGAKTMTSVTVNGILSMEGTATATVAPTYGSAATLQYNTATPRTNGVEWITPFAATGGVIVTNTGTITLTAAKVFNASVPLAIQSGAALAAGNNKLTLGDAFTSSGSFTSAGTVEWNAAGPQSIATGAYNNVIFSGSGAKSLVAGTTVAGNLSIAPSGSATAGVQNSLNLAVDSLTLGGVPQVSGTWGSSASSASHTNDVYFSPSTGYLTVNTDTAYIWNGAGDWFADTANWSAGSAPVDGAAVTIASGSVTLTNATPMLNSLTMTNGTLTFSNLNAVVQATNVWILGGTVQHVTNSASAAVGGVWPIDGRVYFSCTNFFMGSLAIINANGRGWRSISNNIFCGPGTPSADSRVGAGYGGLGQDGGTDGPGLTYGSASEPDQPGSGGRQTETASSSVNGSGGGLVRIDASGGTVTINGTITANGIGKTSQYVGGGSGGGIWISCQTFAGTNGTIRANGTIDTPTTGASGAGGRIAIHYNTVAQPVTVSITASRTNGDVGTIYLSDTSLLRETLNYIDGQIVGPWNFWGPTNLTVSANTVRFVNDGFTLAVSNNLTIIGTNTLLEIGGGSVMMHECFLARSTYMDGSGGSYLGYFNYSTATSTLTCGGNLVLTNAGRLRIYSGATNAPDTYGALVDVKGDVTLNDGAWIHPVSNPTNGGSALFRMHGVTIASNAGFNATQVGYGGGGGTLGPANGYGPGSALGIDAGGSYGGRGGNYGGLAGITYGSSNAPVDPGSGGGRNGNVTITPGYSGGSGGGLIRLLVAQTLDLDGTLTANGRGTPATGSSYGGGGSGGGINVRCRTLTGGSAGVTNILANGGDVGRGGSGGGGRIAVLSADRAGFAGSTSVNPGTWNDSTPYLGATGTVAWLQLPPDFTVDPTLTNVQAGAGGKSSFSMKAWNSGLDTNDLFWTATTSAGWLVLGTTNGVISQGQTNTIAITNDATSLAIGEYTGQVVFVSRYAYATEDPYALLPMAVTATVVCTVYNASVPSVVSFSPTASAGDESVASVPLTVVLDVPSSSPLSVDYSVTGGTAQGGDVDYTLTNGTLTILPGNTSSNIYLTVIDDGQYESNETVVVTLGNPVNATLGTATNFTYTILDNDTFTLTIAGSPANYAAPSPLPYGVNTNIPASSWVTNSVDSYVTTNGTNWFCTGWALKKTADEAAVTNGTGAQAEFQMTTNLTLTWCWANGYYLTVTANSNGTASALSGWYTNGVQVQVAATADVNYVFLQWTGDVPTGHEADNPLTVTMNQPRTIQAQFAGNTPATRTWNGTGNWFTVTNWTPQGIPGTADSVYIISGNCLLADPVTVASATISNATLTFSNWDTALSAASVSIGSSGVVTHAVNSDTAAPWVGDARVWIVCSNLSVAAAGSINVVGKGYGSPASGYNYGYGPGTNGQPLCGGGHGGRGADIATSSGQGSMNGGGVTYDSLASPTEPGTGGAPSGNSGGFGGGVVRIEATGTVDVNGPINADGGKLTGTYPACGSGGSVYITCLKLTGTGTGSVISANGGLRAGGGGYGGGGGGGRIAIVYDTNAQATVAVPSTRFSVAGSQGANSWYGYVGTLYFSDNRFLTNLFVHVGEWNVPGFTNWTVGDLAVTNGGWLKFPAGFRLTVTNQCAVRGATTATDPNLTRLEMEGGALNCTGDILVTNGSLKIYANAVGTSKIVGATLNCGGSLTLASANAVLGLYCDRTNGSYAVVTNFNFILNQGGRVETTGYSSGYGPGRGSSSIYNVGGSYGGFGSVQAGGTVGSTYGSSNAPTDAGSPGSPTAACSGPGGGVIRIVATGTMRLNGSMTATGTSGSTGFGAGSGGSIYLTARRLEGSNGVLRADGGISHLGYSGGGGRIAVWVRSDYTGGAISNSAAGGVYAGDNNNDGTPGTIVWGQLATPGSIITFR